MKKILITGANGFIGQHVADIAVKEGYTVLGIDLSSAPINSKIRYFQRNLQTESMMDILEKYEPDVIVHCAGLADVNYSVRFPESDFYANVAVTRKILFAIKDMKHTCRFIYLSSAAVYGQPKVLPICEKTELTPMSPYALHKKMAEDICIYCAKQYLMDIVILRVFSAYGPGLRKQLFWDMWKKLQETGQLNLYGTGEESRDYIYITDLVSVIMSICRKDEKLNHIVYNVANGIEIYIRQAAEIFSGLLGYSSSIVHFDQCQKEGNPINWRADIERLAELGYKPNTNIEQGIKNYVEWLRRLTKE